MRQKRTLSSRFPGRPSFPDGRVGSHPGEASETSPGLCFICGEGYAVAGPIPVVCEDGRQGRVCLDCAEDSTVSREDIPSCWATLRGDDSYSAVPLFEDCEVCHKKVHRAKVEVVCGFVVCKDGNCAELAIEIRNDEEAEAMTMEPLFTSAFERAMGHAPRRYGS